ncbi:MAG: hypothetical protein MRY63_11335 [Neomegalonema sp.]|nr:hypothetical protein [Neomegalonema sp.]
MSRLKRRAQSYQCDPIALSFLIDRIVGIRSDMERARVESPPRDTCIQDAVSRNHLLSIEDAEAIFDDLSEGTASRIPLLKTLQQILTHSKLRIHFEDDEPTIDLNNLHIWHQITSRLEPDTLICCELARRGWANDLEKLSNWGIVTGISDRDLATLTRRGLSDLHVHLGGIRSPHLLWLDIVAGEVPPQEMKFFQGRGAANARFRENLIEDLKRVRRLWASPRGDGEIVDQGALNIPVILADNPGKQQEVRLLRERKLLLRGFARIGSDYDDGALATERALKWYIRVKSRFICNLQQGIETSVGLAAFRGIFSSSIRAVPRSIRKSIQRNAMVGAGIYGRSFIVGGYSGGATIPSRQIRQLDDAFFVIGQSQKKLRRLELRAGPCATPQEYYGFLQAWDKFSKTHLSLPASSADRGEPEIRFAIHFKRSLARRANFQKFILTLDRESAVLHQFRKWALDHQFAPGDLGSKIARIDFAGQERSLPSYHVAFVSNLLRGDHESHMALERLTIAQQRDGAQVQYPNWCTLCRQGRSAPLMQSRQLGVTCHSGEDFAQVVEGVHEIWSSVSLLNMRSGDTIGHGLALAVDPEQHRESRPGQIMTQEGKQFDAYAWLYTLSMRENANHGGRPLRRLEEFLWRTAETIYGSLENIPSLRVFELLNESRRFPIAPEQPGWPGIVKRLHEQEAHSDEIIKRRLKPVPVATIGPDLDELVSWAQERTHQELRDRGVILEFNPSSNWRMHGALGPENLPFLPLLATTKGRTLATLATDNPGVYGTRIENEYAITFDALRKSDVDREEALAILEQLRQIGIERVY